MGDGPADYRAALLDWVSAMTDNIGKDELRAYAERFVRLDEERQALVSDISELKAEVKGRGYNLKAFAAAIKRHRMTAEQREQFDLFEEETALYLGAIEGAAE